jgi:hypothetical protein
MENCTKIEGRPRGLLLAHSIKPGIDGWHFTRLEDEAGRGFWKKYKTVSYGPGEGEEWWREDQEPA